MTEAPSRAHMTTGVTLTATAEAICYRMLALRKPRWSGPDVLTRQRDRDGPRLA